MAATLDLKGKEDVSEKLFKLEKQNLRLIEQNKKLAQESKRATRTANQGLRSQVSGLQKVVYGITGAAGVTSAIRLATSGYAEWADAIQLAGTAAAKFHGDLIRDLSEAGDLMRGKQLTEFFENVEGVKRGDVAGTYAGVRGGAPAVTTERAMELAGKASRIAPTGQDLRQFGELVGELGETLVKKSADDISDLALSLRQRAGKSISKLTSPRFLAAVKDFSASGVMSAEEAFAAGLTALEHDIPATLLSKVSEVIGKTYDPKSGDQAMTDFAEADAKGRFAMLQQSAELQQKLLGEQGVKFARFPMDRVQVHAQALKWAQSADVMRQEVDALKRFPAGQERLTLYQQQAEVEKLGGQKKDEQAGTQEKRYEEFIKKATAGKPWYARAGLGLERGQAHMRAIFGGGRGEGYHQRVASMIPEHEGSLGFQTQERALAKMREGQQLTRVERETLWGAPPPPGPPPAPAAAARQDLAPQLLKEARQTNQHLAALAGAARAPQPAAVQANLEQQ